MSKLADQISTAVLLLANTLHSIGEYAALTTSDVLGLEDALLFVAKRADLMYSKCRASASSMLACCMSPSQASQFLTDALPDTISKRLSVACHNSPEGCVIAGPTALLVEAAECCKAKGVKSKLLDVSYGFHSSAMDPILDDLEEAASSMAIHEPSVQLGSSVRGKLLDPQEPLSTSYLAMQTRQPVLFMELLREIQAENAGVSLQVVEVGPSPSSKSLSTGAEYMTNSTNRG